MKNQFDHERAAIDDIVARPDVTGEGEGGPAPEKAPKGKDSAPVGGELMEPDRLEMAAGKVVSKAIDDLKDMIGMTPDNDFSLLMTETMGGIFAAIRGISGRPWVRFAVAAGAIGVSIIPPTLRFMARKNEKEEGGE